MEGNGFVLLRQYGIEIPGEFFSFFNDWYHMSVCIKIINCKSLIPEQTVRIDLDQGAGSIGRGKTNCIVLNDPDKYISRSHATLYYENGRYHLKDTSLAGTFLVNKDLKLQGGTVEISDGDIIRIGEYDLVVSLSSNDALDKISVPVDGKEVDLLDNAGCFDTSGEPSGIDSEDSPWRQGWGDFGDDLDGRKPFFTDAPAFEVAPQHGHFDSQDIATQIVTPKAAHPQLPQDYSFKDLLDDTGQTPEPSTGSTGAKIYAHLMAVQKDDAELEPKVSSDSENEMVSENIGPKMDDTPTSSPTDGCHCRPANTRLLEIFMDAVGIRNGSPVNDEQAAELMQTAGALFKEIVAGLLTVLRGRAEMKNGFRVMGTLLKCNGNNPLKFSPSLKDALDALLVNKHSGFSDPVTAVRECFMDIMHHELAMNAGMQAGVMDVVKRFDPENIEQGFSEGVVFQKKAKCWQAYCQSYPQIVEESIDHVFSEVFSQGYEAQIEKLRDSSNNNQHGKK